MSFFGLLQWTLWEHTRPRKLFAMALIGVLGPGMAALLKFSGADYAGDAVYGTATVLATYTLSLVLLSVVFATGAISSEMLGQTIPYLLTRPVSRTKLLLAKWSGAVVIVSGVTIVAATLSALIAFGPSAFGESVLHRDWLILIAGAMTYCSLFAFLSTVTTKPWIVAIVFGFFWESWVSLVPGDFQKLSVLTHLKNLSPHAVENTEEGGLSQFLASVSTTELPTQAASWNTLAVIVILALGVATMTFTTGQYVPKEEAA